MMKNIVVGANQKDAHLINVNFGRDFTGEVLQIRATVEGDICPICGAPLAMERGIEVGQIFKLGTKYSSPMNCTYTNDAGVATPMVMGCYGIGVTRTMSSIIEQYHDEYGIKWPLNVAPYHAVVVPINYNDETMKDAADKIYDELRKSHAEVILDDRDAKPGFKFKDWELIGIPYMIIVGKRASEGICEFKNRATLEKEEITFEEAINRIKNLEIE
jgi:prolyl-tRNA synthetase